jgi:hypothetical protein
MVNKALIVKCALILDACSYFRAIGRYSSAVELLNEQLKSFSVLLGLLSLENKPLPAVLPLLLGENIDSPAASLSEYFS